ncbi:MAG: cytochrome c biogenesis protein CcdA [Acidimicrobiia bacterium]|nr:cytochrome c biogenesis protein CcdA [Acidimicrobiia bacterium]MYC57664.1 cytochrome c biogenesis protein CcdA [Acidimicrobiia bacterium]MYI31214.1 cytochrome c biogenesis protein CcdA [Acidimicrobiia bacterium]
MFDLDLTVPFGAGLVAAVNPCGFAMLPAYLAYFLGISNNEQSASGSGRNALAGLRVGLTLTAGFVAFFGIIGALTSSLISTSTITSRGPWITLVVSGLMVLLGIAMLCGVEPKISVPRLSKGGDSRRLISIFLFGVSYAVVSLGCASPVFLGSVSGAFSSDGWWEGTMRFLAYALGMGLLVTFLTLAVAMGRSGIAAHIRRMLPHINRISGGFLILAGVVLGFYGWWEVQVLLQDDFDATNPFVEASTRISSRLENWIIDVGGNHFGLAAGFIMVGLLLWLLRHNIPPPHLWATSTIVTASYLVVEGLQYGGNLILLPALQTCTHIPERVGNWFTDPTRWPVLWEVLAGVIVGIVLWFRLRPSLQPNNQALN